MNKWRTSRIKSFYHAFSGLGFNLRNEPNFRFQFGFAVLVIAAAIFFHVTRTEWLFLMATIGVILSVELLNTAIEKLSDRITDKNDPVIKTVKDSGAGAVLVSSIFAVVTGLIIFLPYIIEWFSF